MGLARRRGITLPDLRLLRAWDARSAPGTGSTDGAAATISTPADLGRLHELSLDAAQRRARGVFYTPEAVARRVASWALDAAPSTTPVVCDPAAGGGAFLLAAAEVQRERGAEPADVVRRMIVLDIDPLAVAVAEAALCLWCDGRAVPIAATADSLTQEWPVEPEVVVGNPPFLSQLAAGTTRTSQRTAALVERLGEAATGYVDDAALFLLVAARRVHRHGAVALLQPEPVLSVAGAAAVRDELAPWLDRVWLPGKALFADADVRVAAVVLRRDRRPGPVRCAVGPEAVDAGEVTVAGSSWSPIVATARGVPPVSLLPTAGVLGDHCTITAGFRDEYYGLGPFVHEAADLRGVRSSPLVTSGLIDPAACRWGRASARYGRQSWDAPAVALDGIATSPLASWAAARLVPKILVATQTPVVEAVADPEGTWLPCTPVLSVEPGSLDLWHVLALLLAPPVSAWAMHAAAGAALSGDAVKLSAAQLRRVPLPVEVDAWAEAASAVRAASSADSDGQRREALLRAAGASCRAYRVDPSTVLEWWAGRLPVRPAVASSP